MKAFVHGNPETAAIWTPLVAELARRGVHDVVLLSPPGFGAPTPARWDGHRSSYVAWLAAELRTLIASDASNGEGVDLVGHDWGAGHVFGLLDAAPELARTWTTDCGGLLHPDYVWHDAAQTWQTPGAGEAMVAGMVAAAPADRAGLFTSLGMSSDAADEVAGAVDDEMARCILALYRSAAQPAMAELGQRLARRAAAGELPPGLVVVPSDDPYVGTPTMAREVAATLDAGTVELDGRGHWWMFTGLDQVADALVRHWAGAA